MQGRSPDPNPFHCSRWREIAIVFPKLRAAPKFGVGIREENNCMDKYVVRFRRPVQINSLAHYWIRDYRANRYLQRLSKNDLLARIADIVSNVMALGDDGVYRPRFRVRKDHIYAPMRNLDFLRMEADAWDEMRLRGEMPLPALDTKRLQIAKRLSD
jgi:hypothetical protein